MQSYNVVRIISLWRLLKITLTEASVAYCMTSTQVTYWSHGFKKKCILLVRNIWSNSVFQNSIPASPSFSALQYVTLMKKSLCHASDFRNFPRFSKELHFGICVDWPVFRVTNLPLSVGGVYCFFERFV